MDLKYIDDLLDCDKCYLYHKSKPILSASNIGNLRKEIKQFVEAPNENIKVHIVSFNKTTNKEQMFMVSCFQSTITPKLFLVDQDDDGGNIITYSEKELQLRRFRVSDVVKIIKAITNHKISFSSSKSSVSEILDLI